MANILVRGALVVSGTSPSTITARREDVWIEGNAIARVGTRGTTSPDWQADETIDATDHALIPGMVNCHTHAAMTLLRGYADDLPLKEWLEHHIWPVEDRLTADDVYHGTMLAAAEMIRAGITAFADMYFFMDRVAQAVVECGLRARLSRGLIGIAPDSDRKLEEAIEWTRHWQGAGEGRIVPDLGPHAIYTCPPPFLARVVQAADREGLGLHTHLSETRDEVDACLQQHGKTPVAMYHEVGALSLPILAAHCVHLRDDDLDLLSRSGVAVAHNPLSNMKLASGVAPLPEMLKAGITVGLGTDGAASTGQLNLFAEMKACALLPKVMRGDAAACDAATAFFLATRGGALALGLERCGLVEPGYLADVCLINLRVPHLVPIHDPVSSLVYSTQGAEVTTVICDGRVLLRQGELTTIDQERIIRLAQQSATRLVAG